MEIINNIEKEFSCSIKNFDIDKLKFIADLIKKHNNNIYITGVGKCETIAIHFSNILKSISYKAFHISIQNSSHGDIGSICKNDLIIVFSKSGNTKELIDFLNIVKIKNITTIGISCNNDAKINKLTNHQFIIPLNGEINLGIEKIPNNSCMMMLIFVNIICKLVEKIKIDEYKSNHCGGSIGNDLKKIKEVMNIDFPHVIYDNKLKIVDIVLQMTNKKIGLVVINDIEGNIIGIITDGDIRRLLLKNKDLNNLEKEDINQYFFKLEDTSIYFKDIKGLLLKYKFIPIVENNKCVGLLCENLVKNNLY